MLLIAGFVGWKLKGANDEDEIRGLRAELDVAALRLELEREKLKAAGTKQRKPRKRISGG